MNMTAERALEEIRSMVISGDEFLNIYANLEHIRAAVECTGIYAEAVCSGNNEKYFLPRIRAMLEIIGEISLEIENDVDKCSKALISITKPDK